MSKRLNIYLAGRISGLTFDEMNKWRANTKSRLEKVASTTNTKVDVTNPVDFYNFMNPRHKNQKEIMQFDLMKVKSSDIVIVNLNGLNASIGSCIECYEAWKKDIPVLAFGDDLTYENTHPWVQCCITRHDKNYKETIEYIKDFYMT